MCLINPHFTHFYRSRYLAFIATFISGVSPATTFQWGSLFPRDTAQHFFFLTSSGIYFCPSFVQISKLPSETISSQLSYDKLSCASGVVTLGKIKISNEDRKMENVLMLQIFLPRTSLPENYSCCRWLHFKRMKIYHDWRTLGLFENKL